MDSKLPNNGVEGISSSETEPVVRSVRGMSLREFSLLWHDEYVNSKNAPWAVISKDEFEKKKNVDTEPQPPSDILMLYKSDAPVEAELGSIKWQFPSGFRYDIAVEFLIPNSEIKYVGKGSYYSYDSSKANDASYALIYDRVDDQKYKEMMAAVRSTEIKEELGVKELKKDWIISIHLELYRDKEDIEQYIEQLMYTEDLDENSHDIIAMRKVLSVLADLKE